MRYEYTHQKSYAGNGYSWRKGDVRVFENQIQKLVTDISDLLTGLDIFGSKMAVALALEIKRRAQFYVPVDLANLRASAYVVTARSPQKKMPKWKASDGISRSRRSPDEIAHLSRTWQHAVDSDKAWATDQPYGKKRVSIGFGAYYALYVHEHPEWNFKQGQGKFLERALLEIIQEFPRLVGRMAERHQRSSSRKGSRSQNKPSPAIDAEWEIV